MIREVNSTEIDSNFTARETQDSSPLQLHGYKQSSKLSQLQNNQLNLLTVTFLAIIKWTAINQSWLFVDGSVRGKRLTITAKLSIAKFRYSVEREKDPARGPYHKKLDQSRAHD